MVANITITVPAQPEVSQIAIPGAQGPANTLVIGTVSTLLPNQSATATITGLAPNQTLNLSIPRGNGVVAGGTTGQVLKKATNTDYDTSWDAANNHTHTASQISDSTATGRSVIVATDATAARTAIGAGTSSLVIGTTSSTAKAGDYLPRLVSPNTQAAAYTFVLADNTRSVESTSATAVTFTIPPNSSVAFPIGSEIHIVQMAAGKVTLAPGAGVTLRSPGSLLGTSALYATITARKRATDEWVISGSLA